MFTVFVISLIISTALAVDQSVGAALANNRNNKITKEASAIYNQISKDRELTNRLLDAYNRRDAALANQLLISSPFGNRIHTLKRAYKQNQVDIDNTTKQLSNIEQQSQQVTGQINEKQSQSQTSGSAIADLISGAANDPDKNPVKYQNSGVTEQAIKEVNYGQK